VEVANAAGSRKTVKPEQDLDARLPRFSLAGLNEAA
jgi:hypothetical protein